MIHNVVVPSVGESITEVSILKWVRKDGELVGAGDLLLELETDKATVEIVAERAGVLKILKQPGERISIGTLMATIDDAAQPRSGHDSPRSEPITPIQSQEKLQAGPAVRKQAIEGKIDLSSVPGTGKGGRVTKGDIIQAKQGVSVSVAPVNAQFDRPGDRRVRMSLLRARIAERLVKAQHTAAILTTFNEADMSAVIALRNQHKEAFKTKYGVPLSFMSFFAAASIEALKVTPEVNASIDGDNFIYHDYYDLGIAVGTDRGLVVPVLQAADKMSISELEISLARLAARAREGKLSVPELSGGTFTISNGGVYGSLLSTPILNPPQSGILGLHKIQDRPVAAGGKIEIRSMMYLALSYDHRLIDGKGAVTFLVNVKTYIENPVKFAEKLRVEL